MFEFLSSNITSDIKKQRQYLLQQQMNAQDFSNSCYQMNDSNNNQNSLCHPQPPSYSAPMHQHTSPGALNPPFQMAPGLFGYSRPSSPVSNPIYPYSAVSYESKHKEISLVLYNNYLQLDPYHHRRQPAEVTFLHFFQ